MSNAVFQDGSMNARSGRQVQRFYLDRLRRMVAIRREQSASGGDDFNLRLIDRALYSTFCDCLDFGAGDEARNILRQEDLASKKEKP